jgi:hypothetical protein
VDLHRPEATCSAMLPRRNALPLSFALYKRDLQYSWCTVLSNLLAPINDWFTEGFDTMDLKEAKPY